MIFTSQTLFILNSYRSCAYISNVAFWGEWFYQNNAHPECRRQIYFCGLSFFLSILKIDLYIYISISTTMQDAKKKCIIVNIPEEMHRDLKKKVVDDGTTISDLVRDYLEAYLKSKEDE